MYNLQSFQITDFVGKRGRQGGRREITNIFGNANPGRMCHNQSNVVKDTRIFVPFEGKAHKMTVLRCSYFCEFFSQYIHVELLPNFSWDSVVQDWNALRIYQDIWELHCNTIIATMAHLLIIHSQVIAKKTKFTLHIVQLMVIIRTEFSRYTLEYRHSFPYKIVACHDLVV